jgi:hypothetical protein
MIGTLNKHVWRDIDHKQEIQVGDRPIGLVDGEANPVDELFS